MNAARARVPFWTQVELVSMHQALAAPHGIPAGLSLSAIFCTEACFLWLLLAYLLWVHLFAGIGVIAAFSTVLRVLTNKGGQASGHAASSEAAPGSSVTPLFEGPRPGRCDDGPKHSGARRVR